MIALEKLNKFPPELDDALLDTVLSECMSRGNTTLQQWESLAYLLFRQRRFEEFLNVVGHVTQHIIDKYHDEQSKFIKIRLYNSLSIYYLIQATRQESFEKSERLFEQVVMNFNVSDKFSFVSSTYSIKGLYSLYRGEKDQTLNYYKTAIEGQDRDTMSVTPCIGMAQMYFAIRNYKEALQYFKKAIKLKPSIAGRARLGLAYCYYNLGSYSLAYYAFKRCVQLEPKNVDALLGLAVLSFDSDDYDQYFSYVCQAYKLNPTHPVALYYLAEHYLYRKQYGRVLKCIKVGMKSLEQVSRFQFKDRSQEDFFRNDWSMLKSRYIYLLGLLRQIEGDYDVASKYYHQAKHFDRNNMLVLFAISQINLLPQSVNATEAHKLLERIIKHYEGNAFINELMKSMAYVLTKVPSQNKKEMIEAYRRALAYNPQDSEIQIEYAQLVDNEDASPYYIEAEKILASKQWSRRHLNFFQQTNEQTIFPELYINMGVHQAFTDVLAALKSYQKCEKLIQEFQIPNYVAEAAEEANKQEEQLKKSVYQIVLNFNRAILMEQIGDYPAAVQFYRDIIATNPLFIDGYARLGYLLHELGDYEEALKVLAETKPYVEKLVQHHRNYKQINPIPSVLGFIQYQLLDYTAAIESFKYSRDDPYSKIFLMAHDYKMAADKNKNQDPTFLKNVLKDSAEKALNILKHESHNLQAAMIIILIIAELKYYPEALNLLENLQEYATLQPRIYSNLGVLSSRFLQEDHYQSARLFFKRYHERTNYRSDDHTDRSIGQMHFDFRNFKEAANMLKRQILNQPGQLRHRLNLNLVIHQECYEILENQNANFQELQQAVVYFKCLLRSYEYMTKQACWAHRDQQYQPHLRGTIRDHHFMIIKQKSEDQFNYINNYQGNFDKQLVAAKEKERRQKQIQEEKEIERRRLKEQQSSQLQQMKVEQDEEEIMQSMLEKMQQIKQGLGESMQEKAEPETKQKRGAKKQKKQEKKKRQREMEDFVESSRDEDYTSNDAEREEQQVQLSQGDGEDSFAREEQFEQERKETKSKKKSNKIGQRSQHKKDKKNRKLKSRLQPTQNESDDDKIMLDDDILSGSINKPSQEISPIKEDSVEQIFQ